MPVDAASIRASLTLDDRNFQQGVKGAQAALSNFGRAMPPPKSWKGYRCSHGE